jgi:peptidyl-prolyl cis-trans isomerase D
MLQTIRNRASGPVAKVLFVFLAFVFGIWGIGDYALIRERERPAIRVGDIEIPPGRVENDYRAALARLRRELPQLDNEMARNLGILNGIIDRIVGDALFDLQARRSGIVISDEMVRQRITADPVFQGPDGRFNRDLMLNLLRNNDMTEAMYFANVRNALMREIIVRAVVAGGRAPDAVVDRLFRHRDEVRSGAFVFIASQSMPAPAEAPSDEQLRQLYDDQIETFSRPEYRALTVLRVGPNELAARMQPDENDIRDEYQTRINEFRTAERRDLEQAVFRDEAAAQAARERVVAGATLAEVAPDTRNEISNVARTQVPAGLVTAFDLPVEAVSAPLRTPFGWHLVRTLRITQEASAPSFEAARERITEELRRRMAGEAAYTAINRVEDAVVAGRSLDSAAEEAGIPLTRIEAVDAQGRQPDGAPLPALAGAPQVAQTAFTTSSGASSAVIEGPDNAFYIVRVDSITPQRPIPLDDVRDRVVVLWQAEQRRAAARARAEEIRAAAAEGRPLGELATQHQLSVEIAEGVKRTPDRNAPSPAPTEVGAELFRLQPSNFGLATGRDGFWVVHLQEVRAADPAANQDAVQRVRTEIQEQLRSDIAEEFAAALRARFGVTTDEAVVRRLEQ